MQIKLNLIPNYKRKEIEQSRLFGFILKLGLELFVLAFFVVIAVVSFQFILKLNFKLAEEDINIDSQKGKFEKIKQYDNEFLGINEQLGEIDKIQKEQLYWSFFLDKISQLVPGKITLNGIITKDYKIILSGIAENRDVLIEFKDNLNGEECFDNIDLPLSNLVSKNNVDFQMEFNLKEECIKKQ